MVRFTWDAAKSGRNVAERGLAFSTAARVFEGITVEREDTRSDYGEMRMIAIGRVDGRMLVVVYTDRDDGRRIISARKANEREQALYEGRV